MNNLLDEAIDHKYKYGIYPYEMDEMVENLTDVEVTGEFRKSKKYVKVIVKEKRQTTIFDLIQKIRGKKNG